jgi:serine/threonine protein kinase
VKKMLQELSDPKQRQMFERDVEILASVDHATLLALRRYVPITAETGDPPAIITEFMPRGSLQGIIDAELKGRRPNDWDDTRRFIAMMLNGPYL